MHQLEFSYSDTNPEMPVAFASFEAMHTIVEVVIAGATQQSSKSAIEKAKEVIDTVDDKLNRHNPTSILAKINDFAVESTQRLDDETYMALELCEVFCRATFGYFDIAALSANIHSEAFTLEPKAHRVNLASKDTLLDMGGFAKGYALDKAKTILTQMGIDKALINFGNSSIAGIGTHPFGESWQVGIEQDKSTMFDLCNSALSVSGKSPSTKAHIVDPVGKRLCESNQIVVVEGTSALICEILSTALYAAPPQQRGKILANFEGYRAQCIDSVGTKIEINR